MPKSLPSASHSYRVRIDGKDDERLVEFCKKFCDKYLLVHHVTLTENPHHHIFVETRYSQGNFSNKIKSELEVAGADYCNQKCDADRKIEYLSYLFNTKKGNQPRLVSYEGFSILDVATYQANAKQIADEFQTRMNESKKTQHDMCLIVIERMSNKDIINPETVYDTVIEVLRECHTMARPNHVRDMIATVMAYSQNKAAKTYIKKLTLKFFSHE